MGEYKFLLIPLIAVVTAQFIKCIIESLKEKRFVWERLLNGTGGMPSSHTTLCFSITTCIIMEYGITSPISALSLAFSSIVAYDAFGLRMESGKQAMAINILFKELASKENRTFKKLKEQLGHKPLEVLCGIIYGSVIAIILMKVGK